ncbi:MAG: single-stranded-DNA-specific exonuclease RecJ [Gemmatimonadota bacterium]
MLQPRWSWPDPIEGTDASELGRALSVPPTIAELLVRRGFRSADRARFFLNPSFDQLHDPFLLRGMDVAVTRIEMAIRDGEPIAVHGDYDVDGITATTVLVRYLRWRGARADYYIPHRVEDGYGVSQSGVEALAGRGIRLLITCDCGVTAVDEIEAARAAGMEVIVTDHHEPGPVLPRATAVLNPKLPESGYPDANLAAVGVVYKLCEALELSAGRDRETLRFALDLVAFGTIADLVPLTGENRVLVRYGLEVLARTRNPGLRALMQRTGLAGSRPTAWQIGFVLAPRINAVGRMDAAEKAVGLLLTDDPAQAEAIAETFEGVNTSRQEEDRRLLAEVLVGVERSYDPERDRAIVMAGEGWHPGVIGIVASRVVERFHRPTVLIAIDAEGNGRGSARSVPGFHLLEGLEACATHLDAYGGHRTAAGLAIRREAVDAFRSAFQRHAGDRLMAEQLVPNLTIDLDLPLESVDAGLFLELNRFAPYGPGNPEPVLALKDVAARGYPRIVGENHLKMVVARNGRSLDTIGFNLGHLLGHLNLNRGPMTIACRLRENVYLGRSVLQGRLIDVRLDRC